ncbi:MAG: flippase-like domain-containing protein [Acidobacteriales bacterium]|nr:flippase-like domain-containing protein [Terriglobales bacterium]
MNKKRSFALILVVAALAALAYLQFRTWRNFDWVTFWAQTRQTNKLDLLAAALLIYFTYYLRAVRWAVMLRPVKAVRASSLMSSMVIGFAGLAILGRPGDLVRPYILARKFGLSFSSQVAVLAVERVFDIGCFTLLLTLDLLFSRSLALLPHYAQFRLAGIGLCFVVAGMVVFLYLVWRSGDAVAGFVERAIGGMAPRFGASVGHKIRMFSEGLHTIHDLTSFMQLMGLSVMIWLVIAVAYVAVTHAYPDPLRGMTIAHVLLVMSASIAGSLLQLPVVGGGSQLGTISVMENVFLIPKELALSCGIMLWLITFVAIVPLGLVLARAEHVSLVKMEKEAEEARDSSQ